MASHINVRLEGVCDQPDRDTRVTALFELALVGVCGGDVDLVGVAWFAVEVRVARLRGEDVALAIWGSSKSVGWFRVPTILATTIIVFESSRDD